MRGDAASMSVLRPSSPEEALELYRRHADAVPLAGGTDFLVAWNAGEANGRRVLDLSRLASWRDIRATGGGARLGALVTHWRVQRAEALSRRLPLLVQGCGTVGGWQIQTRGTLGGNLANASPAADTFPPLAVYEAVVNVASAGGRMRRLPVLDLFAGAKRTRLEPGELIESIDVSYPRRPRRGLFRKVGTRAASAISKTVAAGLLWVHRDGRVRELRFALGSMAPTVRRLHAVEALVRGERLTPELVDEAVVRLADDVDPIDDLRSTRAYRLEVSRNLLRDFLTL